MGYGRWRNPQTGEMMGGYPPHSLTQKRWIRWYASWGGPTHITTFTVPWDILDLGGTDFQYWARNAISKKYGINASGVKILEWGEELTW